MAKILIVDDEKLVRNALRRVILLNSKHEIFEAENGQEGLDVFVREGGVDLILSDLRMTQMDGIEMVTRIRAMGHQVPILMMSAETSTLWDEAQAFLAEGVIQGLLQKPWRMAVAIDAIKKLIG